MKYKRLGRYELVAPIREGGMGSVYLAIARGPSGFEKQVAIKILHSHHQKDSWLAQRFVREAQIVADLRHSNIVQVLDFGKQRDISYLVMEYIKGWNLKELIEIHKNRSWPLDIKVFIMIQIGKGLAYSHQHRDQQQRIRSVIHRDLTPTNILISEEGEVKLGDFGLAYCEGESLERRLEGKPHYLSPEQAQGRELDTRSDLFSLGLIFFELLTGEPFLEGTADEVLHQLRNFELPLQKLRVEKLTPFRSLLEALLTPLRQDRFSSALRVQYELQSFLVTQCHFPSSLALKKFLSGLDPREQTFSLPEKTISRRRYLSPVLTTLGAVIGVFFISSDAPLSGGWLSINVTPWAEVYQEQNYLGVTPLTKIRAKVGQRKWVFKNPVLQKELEIDLSVHLGDDLKVWVDLPSKSVNISRVSRDHAVLLKDSLPPKVSDIPLEDPTVTRRTLREKFFSLFR